MPESTQQTTQRVIEVEASPIPHTFFWPLWISVFAVLIYGFSILFNGQRFSIRQDPPQDPPPPE